MSRAALALASRSARGSPPPTEARSSWRWYQLCVTPYLKTQVKSSQVTRPPRQHARTRDWARAIASSYQVRLGVLIVLRVCCVCVIFHPRTRHFTDHGGAPLPLVIMPHDNRGIRIAHTHTHYEYHSPPPAVGVAPGSASRLTFVCSGTFSRAFERQ